MNIEPRSVPEADMTPMVDVTFLLLIFFMVTAAFTMQSAIVVPKPSPPEPVISAYVGITDIALLTLDIQ